MSTPSAPPVTINGAYQLTVKMTQAGQSCVVVLGYGSGLSGSPLAAEPTQAVGNALLDQVWDRIRNAVSSDVVLNGGTLRYLFGSRTVLELTPPAGVLPGAGGAQTVAAAAQLIKWTTGNGTRSGKGRTFLPGVPASYMAAGGRTLTPAGQTATAGVLAGIITPGTAWPNARLNVLSFKNGAAYPVTGGTVSSILGIQRKRMRG